MQTKEEVLFKKPSLPDTANKQKEGSLHESIKSSQKSPISITRMAQREKHTPGMFSSFALHPDGVNFQDQEPDEEIVLLIRRHFITNTPWILAVLLLSILPPVLSSFIPIIFPAFALSDSTRLIIVVFYYTILFGFILVYFSIWYFNVGLITSKRIIDLDVSGVLFRHVSETKLDLVQDVSYTQVGAVRSLFNYGDILVQTAGTLPNFEFDRAPKPAQAVRIIGELLGKK